MKTLILLLILSCSTLLVQASAWADSIQTFALQQPQGLAPSFQNASNVLLGNGTPLLSPTLITPYLTGNYLAFATTFAPQNGPMELTLTIAGVVYSTGAFVNGVASCVSSFALPRTFYRPVDGVLTVRIGEVSESYGFQFIDPVPEPSTWAMLLTGIAMITRRVMQ